MRVDVEMPFSSENELRARFPDYCVYCDQPASEAKEYRVLWGNHEYPLRVPYCATHKRVADLINATINHVPRMTYALAMLYFVIAILAMGSGKHGEIGVVVMIGAVSTVFVFPFVAIYVIKPFFSLFCKTVWDTPLAGVLGFVARPLKKQESIRFSFAQPAYANRFVEANEGAEIMTHQRRGRHA